MKLLTAELKKQLPPLYATEKANDPCVICKWFTPDSSFTWYVLEFDGEDLYFGLVDGFEIELGYFSLSEIASLRGPLGLRVERDLFFTPTPLSEIRKRLESRR